MSSFIHDWSSFTSHGSKIKSELGSLVEAATKLDLLFGIAFWNLSNIKTERDSTGKLYFSRYRYVNDYFNRLDDDSSKSKAVLLVSNISLASLATLRKMNSGIAKFNNTSILSKLSAFEIKKLEEKLGQNTSTSQSSNSNVLSMMRYKINNADFYNRALGIGLKLKALQIPTLSILVTKIQERFQEECIRKGYSFDCTKVYSNAIFTLITEKAIPMLINSVKKLCELEDDASKAYARLWRYTLQASRNIKRVLQSTKMLPKQIHVMRDIKKSATLIGENGTVNDLVNTTRRSFLFSLKVSNYFFTHIVLRNYKSHNTRE